MWQGYTRDGTDASLRMCLDDIDGKKITRASLTGIDLPDYSQRHVGTV